MRVSEPPLEGEAFAEIELRAGDNVARLLGRACKEFPRWGVDAGQVHLFLAAAGGADRPSSAALAAVAADSVGRLSEEWPLARAGIEPGCWLLARVPPSATRTHFPSPFSPGAPPLVRKWRFEEDVTLLESALRRALTPAQRKAYLSNNFNGVRSALREGRFVSNREHDALLLAQLDGLVNTSTLRRLASVESGLCLGGLLVGAGSRAETRGRSADIFCAVRVSDGALGAAKVFYAAPPGSSARFGEGAASELAVSHLLDTAAAAAGAPAGAARARIVRYSDFFELSRGRAALFMPLYARSLHGLVHESHVGAMLPAAFLLRAAVDVLRGLVLLHAAGVAHCDVKADNIMFDGTGAATLIDLGAATRLGEAPFEGAPEALALGRNMSVASAGVDLACLASTLWWAARCEAGAPAGSTADSLAAQADAAGDDPVMRAVSVILRAASAAEALAALVPGGA